MEIDCIKTKVDSLVVYNRKWNKTNRIIVNQCIFFACVFIIYIRLYAKLKAFIIIKPRC